MVSKKYVWYINLKKTNKRKRKRKKYGKGLGDEFKLLYSLGQQWLNAMRRKKKYAMVKLNVLKRVTFVARYKRISRDQLPPNIVMRRTCTQRAAPRGCRRRVRAEQQGQGIFDFVKKVVRNPLLKWFARQGLKQI